MTKGKLSRNDMRSLERIAGYVERGDMQTATRLAAYEMRAATSARKSALWASLFRDLGLQVAS